MITIRAPVGAKSRASKGSTLQEPIGERMRAILDNGNVGLFDKRTSKSMHNCAI